MPCSRPAKSGKSTTSTPSPGRPRQRRPRTRCPRNAHPRGEDTRIAQEARRGLAMTTLKYGERLHRKLVAELSAAGCFRRAPMRSALFGAVILAGYAAAYAVLLAGP